MNKAAETVHKVTGFLGDVRTELQKSSWPTRGELMESTLVVIVSVALFTAFIGLSDFFISHIIRFLTTR